LNNNNKLINEKLICAFRWSGFPSIMKMHGPKNKIPNMCFVVISWGSWSEPLQFCSIYEAVSNLFSRLPQVIYQSIFITHCLLVWVVILMNLV